MKYTVKKLDILLILLILVQVILAGADYYAVLGVGKRATERQVKKAFRKLTKKYHPDRNTERPKWAKKKFLELTQAYEVLKDEKMRKIYDRGE